MRLLRLLFLPVVGGLAGPSSERTAGALDWRDLTVSIKYEGSQASRPLVDSAVADPANWTSHGSSLRKRDTTIAGFLDKGLLLNCLMQSTQDEAYAISAAAKMNPSMVVSVYTQVPQDLTRPGWFDEEFADSDMEEVLQTFQDVLSSGDVGMQASEKDLYAGASTGWVGPEVQNRAGQTMVRLGFWCLVFGCARLFSH